MSVHPALEAAYLDELQKIAQTKDERTTTDRVLQAAPGVAAVGGAAIGAKSPKMFNPKAFFPKVKVKSTKGRAVSALLGAGTAATTAWLPSAARDTYKAMKKEGNAQLPSNLIQDDEGNPAVKVLGADIEKLDEKTARGVPILQPPPGFVYDPELGAFKPNSEDPAWLTQPEAMQAHENAQAYQAGAAQATQGMAQQEADNAAAQTMMQAQQQAAMMGQAPAEGPQAGPLPTAAPGAQPAAPAVPTPPSPGNVVGDHPMAQGDQKPQVMQPKAQPKNSSNSVAR